MRVRLTVNGTEHDADVGPGESLMDVLRALGYKSVKNGCDHGDCGSCAVLVDGRAVNACRSSAISWTSRAPAISEAISACSKKISVISRS